MQADDPLNIGIVIFEGMTQLDATGPFEVLARVPGAKVLLVAPRKGPLTAGFGMKFVPDTDFKRCPPLDVICIAGGSGINALLNDEAALGFVRRQAAHAQWVTSVCTGSLLLGSAGLLRGRRAGCHWLSLSLLKALGARPSNRRVVVDGKFITTGGVTSGIDFGLVLAAKLAGAKAAKEIQLMIQYDPKPPFRGGTPKRAGAALVRRIARKQADTQKERKRLVEAAARRFKP
ncbi:MAG TPA: DJ-1/PfpI family protein [Opitutaceae bacterium]